MSYTKRKGFGFLLGVSLTNGSFTNIGSIVDGVSSDATAADISTTVAADIFETSLPGQIDPGEVQFTIGYDPADTDVSQTLNDYFVAGTVLYWQISYPPVVDDTPAATEVFTAYIKSKSREVMKDALITSKLTLRISGDPGYAT